MNDIVFIAGAIPSAERLQCQFQRPVLSSLPPKSPHDGFFLSWPEISTMVEPLVTEGKQSAGVVPFPTDPTGASSCADGGVDASVDSGL